MFDRVFLFESVSLMGGFEVAILMKKPCSIFNDDFSKSSLGLQTCYDIYWSIRNIGVLDIKA